MSYQPHSELRMCILIRICYEYFTYQIKLRICNILHIPTVLQRFHTFTNLYFIFTRIKNEVLRS